MKFLWMWIGVIFLIRFLWRFSQSLQNCMNHIMKNPENYCCFLLSFRRLYKQSDDAGAIDVYDEIDTSDLFPG